MLLVQRFITSYSVHASSHYGSQFPKSHGEGKMWDQTLCSEVTKCLVGQEEWLAASKGGVQVVQSHNTAVFQRELSWCQWNSSEMPDHLYSMLQPHWGDFPSSGPAAHMNLCGTGGFHLLWYLLNLSCCFSPGQWEFPHREAGSAPPADGSSSLIAIYILYKGDPASCKHRQAEILIHCVFTAWHFYVLVC